MFVRALREARQFEHGAEDGFASARHRVLMARQAWEAEEYRRAIIDASAAADLAQSVHGPFDDEDQERRILLDELRRAAIDIDRPITSTEARRALETVSGLLDGHVQTEAT